MNFTSDRCVRYEAAFAEHNSENVWCPMLIFTPVPSKHLLVFKTSSRHVLKTSSIRLQRNNFSSSKTSWRCLGRRKIVTVKTSWRHVLKMSAKRLGDKQHVFWNYLYLTNLNVYLRNLVFRKAISDESKLNPKLEPSNFDVCLILKLKQHLYFKN